MEFNEAFEQAVLKIFNQHYKPDTIAKVIRVDKEKNVCDVLVTGSDKKVNDVRLLAVEVNPASKFVVYPKVDSLVSISYLFMNSDTAQVTKYSETDDMELNGNRFGGIVKADVLKTELDKTNATVNAMLTVLNGAPIPEAGNGAVSALQGALKTALTGKVLGSFTAIKNDKVKHG
jgi:hypothetical protein